MLLLFTDDLHCLWLQGLREVLRPRHYVIVKAMTWIRLVEIASLVLY